MAKRRFSEKMFRILLMVFLLSTLVPVFPHNIEALATFELGDYVQFGSYNDEAILWRVIYIDEDGDPLLFSENIISIKAFDSSGDYHTDEYRKLFGSNYWPDSNIRQWLNSADNDINWIQNPPLDDNTMLNAYDGEKGFLAYGNFTKAERSFIKPVDHKVVLTNIDKEKRDGGNQQLQGSFKLNNVNENYDDAYFKNVTDEVFLLSVKELKEYIIDRGWEWRAYPTPTAVSKSAEQTASINGTLFKLDAQDYWSYWLRTPYNSQQEAVYFVDIGYDITGSVLMVSNANAGGHGIRPALYLDMSSINLVDGSGSKNEPFVVKAGDQADSWAMKEVDEAILANLVPVEMQGRYKVNITREDFCNLVIHLISVKTKKSLEAIISEQGFDLTENPFQDTSDQAVIAAYKLGIVKGKGNGLFDPSGNITRQEAAVMLANTAKILGEDSTKSDSNFTDKDKIAGWAKDSVDYVYAKGIMGGVGGNKFAPEGPYTRQQAYITILRLFKSFTELSELDIERLQSYEYDEGTPYLDFQQMQDQRLEDAKYIIEHSLKNVVVLESNQKFITSEKLVYIAWNMNYVVRGVIQETNKDGTISEQDVEYEFFYGMTNDNTTPHAEYHLTDVRVLGEKHTFKMLNVK